MIITGDTVSMESRHSMSRKTSSTVSVTTTVGNDGGGFPGISANGMYRDGFFGLLNYSLESVKGGSSQNDEAGLLAGITDENDGSSGAEGIGSVEKGQPLTKTALQIQFETLNYLFRLLFRERLNRNQAYFSDLLSDLGYNPGAMRRTETFEQTFTYEEKEATSFSTTGKVRTADGREIEFGVNVSMSRSFYQEYTESYSRNVSQYIDPLVIQLDGDVTSVSDQSFFFDLDCDGKEEEISELNRGSGYLALDQNGDGRINDGSELFGAKTGNGFEELAVYDLDGNGWIDEADEIFEHLRVWSKDEKGNDVLYTLKEANVGALCLSASVTPFQLTDANNHAKAMIRQSGFYLKENGMPGLLQQVDMAM